MADQKLLISLTDSFKANVIISKLENAGIESWVLNKQDSSYIMIGDIEIYVFENDWASAQEILGLESE